MDKSKTETRSGRINRIFIEKPQESIDNKTPLYSHVTRVSRDSYVPISAKRRILKQVDELGQNF